jgi:hypothetical protein
MQVLDLPDGHVRNLAKTLEAKKVLRKAKAKGRTGLAYKLIPKWRSVLEEAFGANTPGLLSAGQQLILVPGGAFPQASHLLADLPLDASPIWGARMVDSARLLLAIKGDGEAADRLFAALRRQNVEAWPTAVDRIMDRFELRQYLRSLFPEMTPEELPAGDS